MKKVLGLLLISVCLGCAQKVKHTAARLTDSGRKAIVKKQAVSRDMLLTYDSTVYKKSVDTSATNLMQQYLPGWKFPLPSTWEKTWFHEYKKDGFLVNYIYADFNGDDKKDYAFLLDSNKVYAVWVLQSTADKYKAIKLLNIGALKDSTLNIGIELCPKGKLDYIDFDDDNAKPINLKNPAITIQDFESMAETYYWKKGKYESVTTGD